MRKQPIKSRKAIIQNAVQKVFGDQIKLNFSNKKVNISESEKSAEEEIKNLNEKNLNQKIDFSKSNSKLENPQETPNNNGSQNLANFFNGEIINLDE